MMRMTFAPASPAPAMLGIRFFDQRKLGSSSNPTRTGRGPAARAVPASTASATVATTARTRQRRPRTPCFFIRRNTPDTTARLDELYPDGATPEELAEVPLGRWGSPRELGDVVCFLASERARYVTGQTL